MILKKAIKLGASLAGIAAVKDLKESPSYSIYDQSPYYNGYTRVEWPTEAKSVLVLALLVDPSEPELDWWSDDIPGRTPANRLLMKISGELRKWQSTFPAVPVGERRDIPQGCRCAGRSWSHWEKQSPYYSGVWNPGSSAGALHGNRIGADRSYRIYPL